VAVARRGVLSHVLRRVWSWDPLCAGADGLRRGRRAPWAPVATRARCRRARV